jgi:hypothetical protein
MNQENRPGGLTALAVINFVFAGLGILSLFFMIALFALIGVLPTEQMNEADRAQLEAFKNLGLPMFIFIFVLSIISSVLLLLSGIGYIKQKKFLGWGLGNLYAIITIVSNIVTALLFPRDIGGGFRFSIIIGLIYPVVTLILLNTTFKEDLTN